MADGQAPYQFGLIVTGKGEETFLPRLFRPLIETGQCRFKVIQRIGQRSPVKIDSKRHAKMAISNQKIPDKDEEIGISARRFFKEFPEGFVLLLDDLEYDRAPMKRAIFQRYRAR